MLRCLARKPFRLQEKDAQVSPLRRKVGVWVFPSGAATVHFLFMNSGVWCGQCVLQRRHEGDPCFSPTSQGPLFSLLGTLRKWPLPDETSCREATVNHDRQQQWLFTGQLQMNPHRVSQEHQTQKRRRMETHTITQSENKTVSPNPM